MRSAAGSVGMSETMFSRIERGGLETVTVEQLALACAAVGLRLAGRAYPDGQPVRDVAHANLLRRLRHAVHPSIGWATEVPLPIPGDLRAWDGQLRVEGFVIGVEAEMRLSDLQALDRRIALKRRDGEVAVVILLVADTRGNRRIMSEQREALRASYPLDTRALLGALRSGRAPSASGIVVL